MCTWKWLVDRKSFLLAVILAYLIGLGLATDWELQIGGTWVWNVSLSTQLEAEKSAWDIVTALSTLFAALGTIGLLALAYFRSGEWIDAKRADVALKELRFLLNAIYRYSSKVHQELSFDILYELQLETDPLNSISSHLDSLEKSSGEIWGEFSASATLLKGVFAKTDPEFCQKLDELDKSFSLPVTALNMSIKCGEIELDDIDLLGEAENTTDQISNLVVRLRTLVRNQVSHVMGSS